MQKTLQKLLDVGSKDVSLARVYIKNSSVEYKPFCVNGPMSQLFWEAIFDNAFSVFVGFLAYSNLC